MQRRPGTADAVVVGLAAMLGAGVFAVWTPAGEAAGTWLPVAVLIAGLTALCNAASATDLAVAYPGRGVKRGYRHELLRSAIDRLAGVASLVGKVSAGAAAARVLGLYVLPREPLIMAVAAVIGAAALTAAGVRWTARGAYALVGGTLAVLLVAVAAGFLDGGADEPDTLPTTALDPLGPVPGGPLGVLSAAALVSFAFAGYGRICCLAGEVDDPRRTLRRAVVIAVAVGTAVYLLVVAALVVGLGADRMAAEPTPLAALVDAGRSSALGVVVRLGAAVAAGSVLLSVLARVSGTIRALAGAGRAGRGPRADLAAGAVTLVVVLLAGPVTAMTISVCAILVRYAVVHLAALRLPAGLRVWPAWTGLAGLALCVVLVMVLPARHTLITAAALVLGWMFCTAYLRSTASQGEVPGESG